MHVVTLSMRPRLALAALTAVATLAVPLAAADVAIVKGGPPADGEALATGALAEAGKAMAVCWRAPSKGAIRVAITVAADGGVTASAVSKGAAAQCAAGILAVWTVPGGAWKGEVEIGAGAAAPDLAAAIQQQLLAASGPIKACQAKAPGKAGPAQIKMKIGSDGTIADVTVASKLGAALEGCVVKAVEAIRLKPTGGGVISYQLAVAFSGHDGGAAPPPPTGDTTPPASGTSTGALAPAQIQAQVAGLRAAIGTCVGKTAVTGKQATVRFTVRGDGTVKNIVIKEPSGVAKLDTCIKDSLGAARFPTAAGETKVSLPLAW